jgi:putative ribosome biogenesis GTPase RsgA
MKIIPLEIFDDADLPDVNASERRDRAHARHARLDVICAADVEPELIQWLWENWIAIGKVATLAGNGGLGKSTLLCDWAARITRGDAWPDGTAAGPVGSVIVFS